MRKLYMGTLVAESNTEGIYWANSVGRAFKAVDQWHIAQQ